jgi:hypothetical protein
MKNFKSNSTRFIRHCTAEELIFFSTYEKYFEEKNLEMIYQNQNDKVRRNCPEPGKIRIKILSAAPTVRDQKTRSHQTLQNNYYEVILWSSLYK